MALDSEHEPAPMEPIAEEEEDPVTEDETAENDDEEGLGNMGALGDMLASAFGGGSESGLDDASLIQSFLDDMYDEEDVTTDNLPPPPPMTREDLTVWVLSRYRDAESKYYPDEVKAQVRLLQLVFYTSDEESGPTTRIQRLAREIWKA